MKNIFTTTKKRFLSLVLAVMTILTMVPVTPAMAASPEDTTASYAATSTNWGGLRLAWNGPLTVYEDANFTQKKGTIFQYEGYTVLNVISEGFEVQYSNSKGPQHGYTKEWSAEFPCGQTGLAKIKNTTNVYYGTSTTVNPVAGTVYAGEYVAFLAKNDDWAYIEYDTSSGRKRGYIYYGHLDVCNRWDSMPDIYMHNNPGTTYYVPGSYTIYSGPSKNYASIGSISNENVTVIANVNLTPGTGTDRYSVYIEYNVGNQRKGGFIVYDRYPTLADELVDYSGKTWQF